eukprot:Opistho-1_new@105600
MALKTTVVAVVGTAFSLVVGSIYAMIVLPVMLFRIATNPTKFFAAKDRKNGPAILTDKRFGEHAYVNANGIRFHYVANGKGPLMLCLHGFPEFWYSWRHQLVEFSDSYRVVAVDMRGYGDTDKPRGISPYAIPNLTRDVAKLIRALGYDKAVIMAHDWGGIVAWQFAMQYPELVERLIVMNCPHPQAFEDAVDLKQFFASWYIFFFQIPFLPEIMLRSFDYGSIKGSYLGKKMGAVRKDAFSMEDIEAFKYAFSQPYAATAAINYYRNIFRHPQPRHTITTPTLLVWGEQDKALGKKCVPPTHKYVPNLTVKMIPDASHWVQQDRPDVVNAAVREFLNKKA